MKTRTIMTLSGCAALLLAACDVKDPIFNTPHPDHAMVTLTTDWSGLGEGLTAPESYTVTAALDGSTAKADYTATLTGVTNRLDHLFAPGDYRFFVCNTPDQVDIKGTVASVLAQAVTPTESGAPSEASPADASEQFVNTTPGWLFTGTAEAALARDTEVNLTVPMRQQMRQLTLLFEPAGPTENIQVITGSLSGVAGTFDMADGTHGAPSFAVFNLTKIDSGADAGKWGATMRLLGIAGSVQKLHLEIFFTEGGPHILDSDLSAKLASFNDDKRQPLTLMLGSEAALSVTDWKEGHIEEVDSELVE